MRIYFEDRRGKIEKNGFFHPCVLRNSGFLVSLFQWWEIYHSAVPPVMGAGTGRDLSLRRLTQRLPERLFMAEAENPGFFRFDDAALLCVERGSALEQGREAAL